MCISLEDIIHTHINIHKYTYIHIYMCICINIYKYIHSMPDRQELNLLQKDKIIVKHMTGAARVFTDLTDWTLITLTLTYSLSTVVFFKYAHNM